MSEKAAFRIRKDVTPYGGRRMDDARTDGAGNVVGHINGAVGARVFQLRDLSPVNVAAIDVTERANRERAALSKAT